MPESLLIVAPLVLLAVVLALGFAGCGFEVVVGGEVTLTLKARVPSGLEVLAPGVKFNWVAPDSTTGSASVTSYVGDGADNVLQHAIYSPKPGAWSVTCQLTVRANGQEGDAATPSPCLFELAPDPTDPDIAEADTTYTFQAAGSPATPADPFRIACVGLTADPS